MSYTRLGLNFIYILYLFVCSKTYIQIPIRIVCFRTQYFILFLVHTQKVKGVMLRHLLLTLPLLIV